MSKFEVPTSYSFSIVGMTNEDIYNTIKKNCKESSTMTKKQYDNCLKDIYFYDTQVKSSESQLKFQTYNATLNNGHYELERKINDLKSLKEKEGEYDTIDNHGNLLYHSNPYFKETIPPLKDAVLEDKTDLVNYQNNIYVFSSLVAIGLVVAGVVIFKN